MNDVPNYSEQGSTKTPPREARTEIIRGERRGIPLPNDPRNIINLTGFIQTVTSIPTAAPKSFNESVKIYTDSISSPTVRRLYMYSVELNDWLYVALST